MIKIFRTTGFLAVALAAVLAIAPAAADAKDRYRIAWSIYVGCMPWDYASCTKIVD
ncbi:MAG: hypothetical protein J4G09_08315 [Proteobacteria bacterium]|nr:hypothetical protein [Pseudomonadota bacterium]